MCAVFLAIIRQPTLSAVYIMLVCEYGILHLPKCTVCEQITLCGKKFPSGYQLVGHNIRSVLIRSRTAFA